MWGWILKENGNEKRGSGNHRDSLILGTSKLINNKEIHDWNI